MTVDQQRAAVAFREELLRRFHFVLNRIETRKVAVKEEYAKVAEKETLAVVEAAWTTNPDYSQCADPAVHRLGEELRCLSTAVEFIRNIEIPNAERLLRAERACLDELIEIDREYPMEVTVN